MVEEFVKLFTGLTDDFGKADMSKVVFDTKRNKIKPPYIWTGEPVTSFHYKQHLDGRISIGIQPCTPEGKVSFGCIDIDPNNYKDFKMNNQVGTFVFRWEYLPGSLMYVVYNLHDNSYYSSADEKWYNTKANSLFVKLNYFFRT